MLQNKVITLAFLICFIIFILCKGLSFNHIFLSYSLSKSNETVELAWWDGGECSNVTPIIEDLHHVSGHCGQRAWALGPGQKLISMSLYGKNIGYYKGIEENLVRIKQLYPGYLLRLYVNPRLFKSHLCPLLKKYDHLYVCDIKDLPSGIGNIDRIHGMAWRFTPLGDPQVDIMLVRDSDAKLSAREASAVNEWLLSKTTLHVMNDYPTSKPPIPIAGGLWGIRSDLGKMHSMGLGIKRKLNIIREKIFQVLLDDQKFWRDMFALNEYLMPVFLKDMVQHDSFKCKMYPGSWPWPTQRNENTTFVGEPQYRPGQLKKRKVDMRCPKECRPQEHQDWEYC